MRSFITFTIFSWKNINRVDLSLSLSLSVELRVDLRTQTTIRANDEEFLKCSLTFHLLSTGNVPWKADTAQSYSSHWTMRKLQSITVVGVNSPSEIRLWSSWQNYLLLFSLSKEWKNPSKMTFSIWNEQKREKLTKELYFDRCEKSSFNSFGRDPSFNHTFA